MSIWVAKSELLDSIFCQNEEEAARSVSICKLLQMNFNLTQKKWMFSSSFSVTESNT